MKTRLILFLFAAVLFTGCDPASNANQNTTATTGVTPPQAQKLNETSRPAKITEQMKQRGEQDEARPALKIVAPANGATVNGSTVAVKLDLSGELKSYHPMKDPATGMGNHIHVILDNQPYEAYYHIEEPFELRNVSEGKHTLRVFASRPWHESYKNPEAFASVTFTVKGGGDAGKETTTKDGRKVADPKVKTGQINPPEAETTPKPAPEGKDMQQGVGADIDPSKPLLTFSRPKGEYKDADADVIMIDFWLSNGKLVNDGGDYRVRYSVDGEDPKFIDTWQPVWLSGWTAGAHKIELALVDKSGNVVANGDYNLTTRKITIVRDAK
jgi:hypothetical protein